MTASVWSMLTSSAKSSGSFWARWKLDQADSTGISTHPRDLWWISWSVAATRQLYANATSTGKILSLVRRTWLTLDFTLFHRWGVHNCQPEEAVGIVCKTSINSCQQDYWKCDNNPACISPSFICDEVVDCPDRSDESPEHCDVSWKKWLSWWVARLTTCDFVFISGAVPVAPGGRRRPPARKSWSATSRSLGHRVWRWLHQHRSGGYLSVPGIRRQSNRQEERFLRAWWGADMAWPGNSRLIILPIFTARKKYLGVDLRYEDYLKPNLFLR